MVIIWMSQNNYDELKISQTKKTHKILENAK